MRSLKMFITEKLKINKNTLPDTTFDEVTHHEYWQNPDNKNRLYPKEIAPDEEILLNEYEGMNPIFKGAKVVYFRLVDENYPEEGLAVRVLLPGKTISTIGAEKEEKFFRLFSYDLLKQMKNAMDKSINESVIIEKLKINSDKTKRRNVSFNEFIKAVDDYGFVDLMDIFDIDNESEKFPIYKTDKTHYVTIRGLKVDNINREEFQVRIFTDGSGSNLLYFDKNELMDCFENEDEFQDFMDEIYHFVK